MDKQKQNFDAIKKITGDVAVFYLRGYLDAKTAPILEEKLERAIAENLPKIAVDFKNLDYISSAGLGVFMAQVEEAREKGGDIVLCEMSEKVFSVFDLLGFPAIFDIFDTLEEALDKLKNLKTSKSQN